MLIKTTFFGKTLNHFCLAMTQFKLCSYIADEYITILLCIATLQTNSGILQIN